MAADAPTSEWRLHAVLAQQLQLALDPGALRAFFDGWDERGGALCASLRQKVVHLWQEQPVPWRELLFATEALQEIAWEHLHTGHWMHVHVVWRDAYGLFTLLSVVARLAAAAEQPQPPQPQQQQPEPEQQPQQQPQQVQVQQEPQQQVQQEQDRLAEALRQLDLAAMMGGLRFRPAIDAAIDAADARLQALRGSAAAAAASPAAAVAGMQQDQQQGQAAPAAKRQRVGAAGTAGLAPATAEAAAAAASADGGAVGGDAPGASAPAAPAEAGGEVPLPPGSLTAASAVVPVEHAPGLEQFLLRYMAAPGGPVPCVICGAMAGWPALTRWQDLGYLSRVAGRRTVPVEVGEHYLAQGWGTQLMTLDAFIAALTPQGAATAAAPAAAEPPQQPQPPRMYLAQHQLFEQVPALAADVLTPDYCSLGDAGVSSINAWFGPAGTVTPLHQDPEHNLLAQVVGRKYVRLYDPAHSAALHPHAAGLHTNTSRVDVGAPDDAAFPGFRDVPFTDVVLSPGDMLYLPPRWWHYVKSLSVSFSVSFWWS